VTYFFANGGNLVTLDHDGGLVRDTLIVVNDDISVLLYPQILVDVTVGWAAFWACVQTIIPRRARFQPMRLSPSRLIGTLPDTLHDRSVVIDLKRRRHDPFPSAGEKPAQNGHFSHLYATYAPRTWAPFGLDRRTAKESGHYRFGNNGRTTSSGGRG
jgi:hypothetical protein